MSRAHDPSLREVAARSVCRAASISQAAKRFTAWRAPSPKRAPRFRYNAAYDDIRPPQARDTMHIRRNLAALAAAVGIAFAAHGEDRALLIQLAPDGGFKVWHSDGATNLNEEELIELAASAKPEGGATIETSAGPASAFDTPHGIVVNLPAAQSDKALLIDRDNCGAIKAWHAEGAPLPSDDELSEIVLTALPGGGKRVALGDRLAKGYTTELGVIALIWRPVVRGAGGKPPKPPSAAR